MSNRKILKLVLLGLDFTSGNFGCSALGYSFLKVLDRISIENNVFFEIVSVNYHPFSCDSANYKIASLTVAYSKIVFYKRYIDVVRKSDFVIDFTGGDSFSDIYGKKRFMEETLLKQIAIWSKACLVLGPQTIGPFNNKQVENWAIKVMKSSKAVFARDRLSLDYAKELGIDAFLTTDIAFMLPAAERDGSSSFLEGVNIGINVSALVWNGGYGGNNDFGLTLDYQKYIDSIMKYTEVKKYTVHLIAHVLTDDGVEDDYSVCKTVKDMYANAMLAPEFKNPMEAKEYMSHCDVFIGARMHATVGAFSMGVPTIPVAYSRKFQGLYGSVGYPYIIDAKKLNTEDAVNRTIEWIEKRNQLKENVEESLKKIENNNTEFIRMFSKLMGFSNEE